MKKQAASISAAWDEESRVWMATSGDIPGLFAQADTFDELLRLLPELVGELLTADGWAGPGVAPVPLEIMAHFHSTAALHR
ncbi:MAG: DUF1902 domain-containing protein [Candidatus Adiutrix sp.]|jgi:predicted RNase H-like HicB family nuclease|nr:DUF1902 domain-containing protein [Candidatus Adiutrix sp.]